MLTTIPVSVLAPHNAVRWHGMPKTVHAVERHAGRVRVEFEDGCCTGWLWARTRVVVPAA